MAEGPGALLDPSVSEEKGKEGDGDGGHSEGGRAVGMPDFGIGPGPRSLTGWVIMRVKFKGRIVMVYSDELTLKDAAAFAGVTEATMRAWVKNMNGVSRVPGGGYRIPRTELQAFIVAKNARSLTGASSAFKGKGEGRGEEKILASLEGENERLRLDLAERTREVKELRDDIRRTQADLKESQHEIRRLEAELRAHLAGGMVTGVSRWIKSKLV